MVRSMFENVEHKLKVVAIVNVICGAVYAFALVIWGLSQSEYNEMSTLIGIISGATVFLLSLISSWFIHAFAELLENTKEMNRVLKIGFAEEVKQAEQEKAEEIKRAEQQKEEEIKRVEQAKQEEKARIAAYFAGDTDEKKALEAKRAEAEERLKSLVGFLSDEQYEERKELEALIQSIDETLSAAEEK